MEKKNKPLETAFTALDKRTEEDLVRTIVDLVNVLGSSVESHKQLDIRQRNGSLQVEAYRYYPITRGLYKQINGEYRLIGWVKLAESFNGQEKYSAESTRIRKYKETS